MIMMTLLTLLSSTIIPPDHNYNYNSFIYRSKITARMILQKETEDIYTLLTNLQLYPHPVYFYSLYSDFFDISLLYSNTFEVFDSFFNDLIDIPDLKWDNENRKILKYDFHCFKAEVLFNKLKTKIPHVKTLNTNLYFCLKNKFNAFSDLKIYIPEIRNIFFYTFSLLEIFEEDRISQVLQKFALIYTVIKKLEQNEIISLECVYFLLGDIIDTLMPFSQCRIHFQCLKSRVVSETSVDNSELSLLRNFGVIFVLEKYIENRFRNSSSSFSRIYARVPDTEYIEIYSNLEKLISFFFSLE